MKITRRTLGSLALASLTSACVREVQDTSPKELPPWQVRLAAIEAKTGGRLGVYAVDTDTGAVLQQRANERFAMCSTFKWALAAAVLERADQRKLFLAEPVLYNQADLLPWAPITTQHVAQGQLPLGMLAEAAVTTSDSTAANLLLRRLGGPEKFTSFVRDTGDGVTRLDRLEPLINENHPGDPRDTTTPRAMAETMQILLTTERLSYASRQLLVDWLAASQTGQQRLRAGLPQGWLVGDKSGSGARGAANDVAIAWPPSPALPPPGAPLPHQAPPPRKTRGPILLSCFASDGDVSPERLDTAHAEVGRLVAEVFG